MRWHVPTRDPIERRGSQIRAHQVIGQMQKGQPELSKRQLLPSSQRQHPASNPDEAFDAHLILTLGSQCSAVDPDHCEYIYKVSSMPVQEFGKTYT